MRTICGLVVNTDAERLTTLLISLPELTPISELGAYSGLILRPRRGAALAATQDFLLAAARTVGYCHLLSLDVRIEVADKLADRFPGHFGNSLVKRAHPRCLL